MDETTTPAYEAPKVEDVTTDEGPATMPAGPAAQTPVA
jgi:hypothetical protein